MLLGCRSGSWNIGGDILIFDVSGMCRCHVILICISAQIQSIATAASLGAKILHKHKAAEQGINLLRAMISFLFNENIYISVAGQSSMSWTHAKSVERSKVRNIPKNNTEIARVKYWDVKTFFLAIYIFKTHL